MYGYPSSRTFPRTAHGANGAFTRSAEYAAAVETPAPSSIKLRPLIAALLFAGVIGLVLQVAS